MSIQVFCPHCHGEDFKVFCGSIFSQHIQSWALRDGQLVPLLPYVFGGVPQLENERSPFKCLGCLQAFAINELNILL